MEIIFKNNAIKINLLINNILEKHFMYVSYNKIKVL